MARVTFIKFMSPQYRAGVELKKPLYIRKEHITSFEELTLSKGLESLVPDGSNDNKVLISTADGRIHIVYGSLEEVRKTIEYY